MHQEADGLQEQGRGSQSLGTTKKGIGPTYSSKVARIVSRCSNFFNVVDFKDS